MTETKSLRDITASLENHSADLEKISIIHARIKSKYEDDVKKGYLTPRKQELYIYTLEEALSLVGSWSQQMFDILVPLKESYAKRYLASPKLGQKLFLEKYEELHKPYDQAKNRLWKLLLTVKGVQDDDE